MKCLEKLLGLFIGSLTTNIALIPVRRCFRAHSRWRHWRRGTVVERAGHSWQKDQTIPSWAPSQYCSRHRQQLLLVKQQKYVTEQQPSLQTKLQKCNYFYSTVVISRGRGPCPLEVRGMPPILSTGTRWWWDLNPKNSQHNSQQTSCTEPPFHKRTHKLILIRLLYVTYRNLLS